MAARISELSFTKNPESEIFIKNPNLTKKKKKKKLWRVGGEGVGVARVSDFFFKKPSLKKNLFFFGGGEGKGGLASISAFVLQRFQIEKKNLRGEGGGREVRGARVIF